MGLLQWLNWVGHLGLTAQIPVIHQFILVQFVPFEHMAERAWWKLAFDNTGFDFDRDFEFAIPRVKMGRRVVIPEHGNDDAEKSADDGHG
jgi:hypothetical protein